MEGTKERQGDYVFTANDLGEYRFCFNNEMSTFAEKLVDFEIAVRFLMITPSTCLLISSPNADNISLLENRSRTKPVPSFHPSKVLPMNRPQPLRSLSSRSPPSSQPSTATKSTSAPARIETLAQSEAPNAVFSTSVSLRV